MSHSPETRGAPTLVLRLSVPAGRNFQGVVAELAAKVAEYLGNPTDAQSAGVIIETLAAEVAPRGQENGDVTFEFHRSDDVLKIEARCAGRSSLVRHPLPT